MKISFASTDGVHVNQHFGWCDTFYMYEVNEEGYHFIKELDASLKLEDEIDKLEYKINSLEDSDIVCVLQIGSKASTMVQKSGIYPMSSNEENIEYVITKIQKMMRENPPLWLKRILLK